MRGTDLSRVELSAGWTKLRDALLVTGFASVSAVAMFGWLAALGWIALQAADWIIGIF